MTTDELKQIITDSKFDSGLKQKLVLLLPRLGKQTLSGLGKEVSRGDSCVSANYIVSMWENFANLLDGLKSKNKNGLDNLSKFFDKTLNKFNGDAQLYVLNLVVDVRILASGAKIGISSKLYQDILNFEISLFWYLPKEEVMFFLENELLFLESRVNLLEHLKVAVLENSWDWEKDFDKILANLLLKNKEKLGDLTVGDWLQEYFNFSSPSTFRTDVVQVAEFLVKNQLVKKLSVDEKQSLSEILKLYVWLQKPELNSKEINSYRQQLEEQEADRIQKLIDAEIEASGVLLDSIYEEPPFKIPPIIPTPKNLPLQKPIQEIVKLAPSPEVMAKPVVKPVNIEEVPKKRPMEEAFVAPGLKMWDSNPPEMGKRIKEENTTSPQPSPHPSSRADESARYGAGKERGKTPTVDIDKKLEDLEKRIK